MATIIKEDSALGATIQEIDLREPLDEDLTAFISRALAENEVIFFRDQEISPQQHKEPFKNRKVAYRYDFQANTSSWKYSVG